MTPREQSVNGAECFALAMQNMRERWLAERQPGETAEDHLRRTGQDTGYLKR